MHRPVLLAALLLAAALAGCGLRGPLYLPDEDAATPGEPVAQPPPGPDAEAIVPPAEDEAGDVEEGVEPVGDEEPDGE